MLLLAKMGFLDARGLSVSYRAAAEPQTLTIDVTAGGVPPWPMAHLCMRTLVDTINEGGAGGADFAPEAGSAERLSGPWDGADGLASAFQWQLRIAAVAPLFMRNVVEELRRVTPDFDVVTMRIAGSLPLDDSPLSVREEQVRAWSRDGSTYLPAWPTPGFPVDRVLTYQGAALRVILDGPMTDDLRLALEHLALTWLNALRNHANETGSAEVVFNPSTMLPYLGTSRTELRAHFRVFLYEREAAFAALVNLLARFHVRVAPLRKVVIEV